MVAVKIGFAPQKKERAPASAPFEIKRSRSPHALFFFLPMERAPSPERNGATQADQKPRQVNPESIPLLAFPLSLFHGICILDSWPQRKTNFLCPGLHFRTISNLHFHSKISTALPRPRKSHTRFLLRSVGCHSSARRLVDRTTFTRETEESGRGESCLFQFLSL